MGEEIRIPAQVRRVEGDVADFMERFLRNGCGADDMPGLVKQARRIGQAVLPGRNGPGHGSFREEYLPGGDGLVHLHGEVFRAGNADDVPGLVYAVNGQEGFLRVLRGGEDGAVRRLDKNRNHGSFPPVLQFAEAQVHAAAFADDEGGFPDHGKGTG